jgi:hypothetical protein
MSTTRGPSWSGSDSRTGPLEDATRIALVAGRPVGSLLLSGHGRADMAIDPSHAAAAEVRRRLVAWAVDAGASTLESLAQDGDRLATLAEFGFRPTRSSFELERSCDVSDLGATRWPAGIAPAPFRPGIDDEEVHEMIYSVWLDVEGHTYRPAGGVEDAVPRRPVVRRRPRDRGSARRRHRTSGGLRRRPGVHRHGRVGEPGRRRASRSWRRARPCPARRGVHPTRRPRRRDPRLGVEAANATALGLYRSVGLEVAREFVHCTRT